MNSIAVFGRRIPVPGSVFLRVPLGIAFVLGGVLGFLPVVGFWMLPLGLLILSIDFPPVRRFRRRITVSIGTRFKQRWPSLAARMGFTKKKTNA